MKNLTLIALFLFITLAGKAQPKTYDTIPYVLEYHKKQLERFSQEPVSKGKIMFLGSSIIQFCDWKNLLSDSTVVNRGIAGDITFGVLHRLDNVIEYQPSKLFLEIGINDISKNIPEDVIVKNIISIVEKVKQGSPETKVYVVSVLPTNDSTKNSYPAAYNKNATVERINKQLRSNTKEKGFVFINLSKELSDKQGKLDVKYAKKDGLHLNPEGYQRWVELLKKRKYL